MNRHEEEPLSIPRVIEFVLAMAALLAVLVCWGYGYVKTGGILARLWLGLG